MSTIAYPQHSLLLRLAWFALAGYWLGLLAAFAAWAFNASLIGLPLGLYILNRLPQLATLYTPRRQYILISEPAETWTAEGSELSQVAFRTRALYFLLVGWWANVLWLLAAWVLAMTLIGVPVAFWMYDCSPGVATLRRR